MKIKRKIGVEAEMVTTIYREYEIDLEVNEQELKEDYDNDIEEYLQDLDLENKAQGLIREEWENGDIPDNDDEQDEPTVTYINI